MACELFEGQAALFAQGAQFFSESLHVWLPLLASLTDGLASSFEGMLCCFRLVMSPSQKVNH